MKTIFSLLLFTSFLFPPNTSTFKEDQLKFSRVSKAFERKENYLKDLLKEKRILSNYDLFLRAFKKEAILEVWIKNRTDKKFILLKKYPICSSSGRLGPKRKFGDLQVPEGFYQIDRFNPASNFHLSLGINYPNNSDKVLSSSKNLGGDIFIHGACVTVGCIPLTDDLIEELYLLSVDAKSNGQKTIPVHIFPSKLSIDNFNKIKGEYIKYPDLIRFWTNLKEGYDFFEQNQKLPKITIDKKGKYIFEG
jgi:murein L,D-transpeptidase YafK